MAADTAVCRTVRASIRVGVGVRIGAGYSSGRSVGHQPRSLLDVGQRPLDVE